VDISRVVSKWIGETEKNLEQAFQAAEQSKAVLLFDEADALFGKRTEVSDANDRNANLETAYLLTRLERFEGLVIMSTNMRNNIDPAFLRRIEYIIDFEEPDKIERKAIWECHVPPQAPIDKDVDFAELATMFSVVGGVIKNAVVSAAYSAAAAQRPICKNDFIQALRREYEKQGKAFPVVKLPNQGTSLRSGDLK
jgi:SpoVK/Ycf46/Vps4 family AAA+-type ATPase